MRTTYYSKSIYGRELPENYSGNAFSDASSEVPNTEKEYSNASQIKRGGIGSELTLLLILLLLESTDDDSQITDILLALLLD